MIIRRFLTAVGAVLSAVPAVGGLPAGVAFAKADSFIITNRADDGSASSLRAALDIVNADGGDWIIQLQPGAPYIINRKCGHGDLNDNHGGDLDINSPSTVTIQSTGPAQATIQVTCAGERAIDHTGGGELHLARIHITGGNTADGAKGDQSGDLNGHDAEPGGAVRSNGTVNLQSSLIEGNSTGAGGSGAPPLLVAGSGGYGGHGGGGSAIAANMIVARYSEFANNVSGRGGAGGNGVGAANSGGSGGGGGNGTLAAFTISLYRVRIDHNILGGGGKGGAGLGGAGGAGGAGGSGAGVFTTTLEAQSSTIDSNVAGDGGAGGNATTQGGTGGGGGFGGGAVADLGFVRQSTIDANTAGLGAPGGTGAMAGVGGGAGYAGGVRTVPGPGLTIELSTITSNRAASGANLDVPAGSTLLGSIVGDPRGGGANCAIPITSQGYNAYDSAACGVGPRDVVLPSLPLGPLGDNGGPTPTRMPLAGSALISSIPADLCAGFGLGDGYDQRGQARPSDDCEPGSVEVPIDSATRFVPLPPARVFDTREPGPASGYIEPGTTRTVQFAGVAGIPATGATAVAFNLTIDAAGGAGYVTASPSGLPRPLASNINVDRPGQTAPNFVVVPLGADGRVDFFVQSGGHLLADVIGYFAPAQVASAGRIVSILPKRVFDTREPGSLHGKVPAGGTITVPIPSPVFEVLAAGPGELAAPAADDGRRHVDAVVLNITATEADDAGYITAYPSDVDRPLASTLNLDGPGHTAANLTIVPIAADGTIRLYSQSGAHLLADMVGFVTGYAADLSADGLIVPLDPVRVFDTRDHGASVPAGGTIDVSTAGQAGIPADAAGVLLNVTATEAVAPGYVTGWLTGAPQPVASTVNLTHAGETRANGAILAVGDGGAISYYSQSGTHLLADAFGYLLTGAQPAL